MVLSDCKTQGVNRKPVEVIIFAIFFYHPQTKNASILGFCWTNWNEIVFVTDQGIEFYQVR